MRNRRKRTRALDKYVVFSITILLIFTICETVITAITGTEQSTLITCFFACFGGELFLCAMIKRLKLKEGNRNEVDN